MSIPFWSNDPTVLFNKAYILEIFPNTDMYYEQKLNAVTRLIIVISLLGYIFSRTVRIPIAGVSMIAVIYFIFRSRKYKITSDMILHEGFQKQGDDSRATIVNPETLESVLKSEYKEGNKKNPFRSHQGN